MATSIIVALLAAFGGLVVWFTKLILLERYQFMDKIGGKPIGNPYVMIRLDRLTGAVHAFNWAGWVKIKPHSGYPGTETPDQPPNTPQTASERSKFRKIAREAVIFMLLGLVVSSLGGSLQTYRDRTRLIQAERDWLKTRCDSIGPWVGTGLAVIGTMADKKYISQAECGVVFGTKLYPPHPYNPGVVLPQEQVQQDADALTDGERIKSLKVSYAECALGGVVSGGYGSMVGFGLWLFYRLVRFAIMG